MTITLEPETEAKLRETAHREGQALDALANALLAEVLEQKAREFAETVAAIQESLDSVREGRERPFGEFLAEHRGPA
jgi:hypothetical protein